MGHYFILFEAILSYFSQNPLDNTLQTVNTCIFVPRIVHDRENDDVLDVKV